MHFAQSERNGLTRGSAGLEGRNALVDEVPFDVAAIGKQYPAHKRRSDWRGVEVRAAFEAMAGVSVQAVAARGAAYGDGVKPRGFDEDVGSGGGDHGVPPAH